MILLTVRKQTKHKPCRKSKGLQDLSGTIRKTSRSKWNILKGSMQFTLTSNLLLMELLTTDSTTLPISRVEVPADGAMVDGTEADVGLRSVEIEEEEEAS